MLVNDYDEISDEQILSRYSADISVEFIRYYNYDRYCKLCFGVLELDIDNKRVTFGPSYESCDYPSFFSPTICFANADVDRNASTTWETDVALLPEELRPYAKKIDMVINENMPTSICRGCD